MIASERFAPGAGLSSLSGLGPSGIKHVSMMGKKDKKTRSLNGSPFESGVDHVLDLRGMIIPLTLLKITQAFRNINAGETIDIFGSDPDTKRDFLKVLATTSCEVLHIKNEKDGYLIRLRKGTTRKEA